MSYKFPEENRTFFSYTSPTIYTIYNGELTYLYILQSYFSVISPTRVEFQHGSPFSHFQLQSLTPDAYPHSS